MIEWGYQLFVGAKPSHDLNLFLDLSGCSFTILFCFRGINFGEEVVVIVVALVLVVGVLLKIIENEG